MRRAISNLLPFTLAWIVCAACVEAQPRATPKGSTVTFDEAVALLSQEGSMCRGAEALARLDDARAILPLGRAYRQRTESSKQCLIEAIVKVGRADRLVAAFETAAPADRATLLICGYLSPSEDLLPLAERSLTDENADVRWQARRMLSNWKVTPAWRATMCRALSSTDKEARAKALELLERIKGEDVDAALAAQAAREADAALKQKLTATIEKRATPHRKD